MTLTRTILALSSLAAIASAQPAPTPDASPTTRVADRATTTALPYRGVDASFVPAMDALGVTFTDPKGQPADPLELLADRGVNLLRIRLLVNPPGPYDSIQNAIPLAKRAHALGMSILINFHYSDTWADPAKQFTPDAWAGQDLPELAATLRAYTRDVVATFHAQGVPARFVALGNEVTDGILWPTGRISTNGFTPFATLHNAAAQGVREALPPDLRPQVILHLDRGGDPAGLNRFLDQADDARLDYDVLGLSFYTVWHGPIAGFRSALDAARARTDKPIFVVETAYPFTTAWNDNTTNIVGDTSVLDPCCPPTPEGQARYAGRIIAELRRTPDTLGLVWWGPTWVAAPGLGSPWENMTLFDFNNRLLPAANRLRP